MMIPLLVLALTAAVPQDPPSLPGDDQAAGLSREEMWPAPTPEDWQRPVLVPFQRTWADALEVARTTGKPILACINMDGEIASEHYAGKRYRDPEVAKLFEPFVCVIASVYRHNAQDYDAQGHRILCPRFGSVTCGEHIALEPTLFELYLDGERVAPRHVVVELDGSESRDIYYANDTASVFRVLHESAAGRPEPRNPGFGDRPVLERLASSDLVDRTAVEQAFVVGDASQRRALLQAALAQAGPEQLQLWRLGLHSGVPELARLAVEGLSRSSSPAAIDLILASLRGLHSSSDQAVLLATLERIGEASPRARQLVRAFRGLDASSDSLDGQATGAVLASNGGVEREAAVATLEALDAERHEGGQSYAQSAAGKGVSSPMAALQRAQAALQLARSPETDPRFVGLHLEDVARDLEDARPLTEGPEAWRWQLTDLAFDLARGGSPAFLAAAEERAVTLVPSLPPAAHAEGGLLLRDVLAAFVRGRERAIQTAAVANADWPAEWMADAKTAFAAIEAAPGTTAAECIAHRDFLVFMGAFEAADRVLQAALLRFPLDALVHDRLRGELVRQHPLGALDGLEGSYEALLAASDGAPRMQWYAGYAARFAAEIRRRRGQLEAAVESYRRAEAHFQRSAEGDPTTLASSDFQRSLCLAGEARIALELEHPEQAAELLVASFDLVPEGAASLDGLNTSGILTAQLLLPRLSGSSLESLQASLDALRALDEHLFDPPSFERSSIGRGPVGFGGRRFSGPR